MWPSWLAQPFPWPLPCEHPFSPRAWPSWPRRSPSSCRRRALLGDDDLCPCPRPRRLGKRGQGGCGSASLRQQFARSDGSRSVTPESTRSSCAPCACTHRELLGALSGTFRHGRGVARGGAALHLIGPSLVQGGESGVERLCASRFVLGAGLGGDHLDDATAVVAAAAAPAAPAVAASSASSCHCVDVSWVFCACCVAGRGE